MAVWFRLLEGPHLYGETLFRESDSPTQPSQPKQAFI